MRVDVALFSGQCAEVSLASKDMTVLDLRRGGKRWEVGSGRCMEKLIRALC